MAALQRTVALVEMNGVAVPVCKDLHLNMARRVDIFLDQDALVAESGLGLAHGGAKCSVEIGMLVDAAHALAAAAGDRLDQNRIADLIGFLLEEFRLLHLAMETRHHRHAGLFHQRLGAILQAHGAHGRRRRADEDDAGIDASLRERRVLG